MELSENASADELINNVRRSITALRRTYDVKPFAVAIHPEDWAAVVRSVMNARPVSPVHDERDTPMLWGIPVLIDKRIDRGQFRFLEPADVIVLPEKS